MIQTLTYKLMTTLWVCTMDYQYAMIDWMGDDGDGFTTM